MVTLHEIFQLEEQDFLLMSITLKFQISMEIKKSYVNLVLRYSFAVSSQYYFANKYHNVYSGHKT